MKSILSPEFKYRNADETKDPGYLKRRFEAIRKARADKPKQKVDMTNVAPLKAAGRSK